MQSLQFMKHSWIARIKKGDVLRSRSGVLRVVRGVTHSQVHYNGPPHIRTNVVFAIKHCSWTGRPYTVYTGNDLVQMGYRPTSARVSLRKKIDRAIERTYHAAPDWFAKKPYEITCCDVSGVVS
jgi:hypothetical protein